MSVRSLKRYDSRINNDGVPLQVVVSSTLRGSGLGFIMEPGDLRQPLSRRVLEAGERLSKIFPRKSGGGAPAVGGFGKARAILLPRDPRELDRLEGGGVWMAVRFKRDDAFTLSVYFNGKWGDEAARAERPLKLLSGYSCRRCAGFHRELQPFLLQFSRPLGQAVSVGGIGKGISKLYYRTFDPRPANIREVYSRTGLAPSWRDFERFTEAILPPFTVYPDPSIVFSIEYDLDSDTLRGIKVDACAHCLNHGDLEISVRWSKLLRSFDVPDADYLKMVEILSGGELSGRTVHHAFIGLGHDCGGEKRFNVYLKPVRSL